MAVSRNLTGAASDVEADAQRLLGWMRQQYAGGRAPGYAPLVLCREALSDDGTCSAADWGRLWRVVPLLMERGLVEEIRLPQGDAGVRLTARGAHGA